MLINSYKNQVVEMMANLKIFVYIWICSIYRPTPNFKLMLLGSSIGKNWYSSLRNICKGKPIRNGMAYSQMLKFGYSENVTKVWKNLPIFWHYYCQCQKYGRFLKHFVAFSEYLNLKFPNGPVNNFQEVFNDPQVLHNEMVQTVTDETFGEIKQVIHYDTVESNAFWCRMPCFL